MSKLLRLLDYHEETWKTCQLCELHHGRTRVVQWRGSETAKVFVVGEAPGEEEDQQGLPFVGRSGRLLDQALIAAGADPKESVFVANRIGCRPPQNRKPELDELKTCQPRLDSMIALVQPKVLLLLGGVASRMVGVREVMRWLGTVHQYEFQNLSIPAVVTIHPSYVLRKGGSESQEFRLLVNDAKAALAIANAI